MGINITFTDLAEDEVQVLLDAYGGDGGTITAKAITGKSAKSTKAPVDDDDDLDDDNLDDDGAPKKFSEADLNAMSAAEIKIVAKDDFGIDIKGLKKVELIEEILAAQDEEEDDLDDEDAADDLDDDDEDDLDDDDEDDLEDDDDLDDDEDDLDDDDTEDEPAPRRRSSGTKAPAKKAVAPRRARR